MHHKLDSTKQSGGDRRSGIYRYYAGFTADFVVSVLATLGVSEEESILDPWNGSGSTTAICALKGIKSVGIDLSPFMQIVADVRSMPRSVFEGLSEVVPNIGISTDRIVNLGAPHVALAKIFKERVMVGEFTEDQKTVLTFLFALTTKQLLSGIKTSNPTWFSGKRLDDTPLDWAHADRLLLSETMKLEKWANGQDESGNRYKRPTLIEGDFKEFPLSDQFDHIITSPPYLTRIDYVQKTLPELLFLRELKGFDINELRLKMLGTVLTSQVDTSAIPEVDSMRSVLKKIRTHDSKASSTYYYRFYLNYFTVVAASLKRFKDLLRLGGTATIVSQGSYYKEVFVDLPSIISHFMKEIGFIEVTQASFRGKNHMALINTRSYAASQLAPAETVTVFRKLK